MKTVCKTCKGSGHDKGSRPVVKFEPRKMPDGTTKRCHVTVKQGSGCLTCGGIGVQSK